VEVRTPTEIADRVEVMRRRDAFDRDPQGFVEVWRSEEQKLAAAILAARTRLADVAVSDAMLTLMAQLCQALGADGLRGELTLLRAARALAAFENDSAVGKSHVRAMAASALRHRLRRNVLDETGSTARIERAVDEVLGR
jgi:magnesium chelatase subunit I